MEGRNLKKYGRGEIASPFYDGRASGNAQKHQLEAGKDKSSEALKNDLSSLPELYYRLNANFFSKNFMEKFSRG